MAGSWIESIGNGGAPGRAPQASAGGLGSWLAASVTGLALVILWATEGTLGDAALLAATAGAWATLPPLLRRQPAEPSPAPRAPPLPVAMTPRMALEPLPAPPTPPPASVEEGMDGPTSLRLSGALLGSCEAMQKSMADIDRTRALLREAIEGIFASYSSLTTRVKRQQEVAVSLADRLAGTTTGEGAEAGIFRRFVAETENSMAEIVQQILSVSKQSMEMANRVDDIVAKVEEIEQVASRSRKLADASSMLAVNAKIEATKAGRHAAGFGVVASEVQNLAVESRAFNEQISHLVSEVRSQVDHTQRAIQQLASQDMNMTLMARGRADVLGAEVNAVDAAIRASLSDMTEIVHQVERDIDQGIRNLQFEDIVTQVLEQGGLRLKFVCDGAEAVADALTPGRSDAEIARALEVLEDARYAPHTKAEQTSMNEGSVELF